MIKEDYQAVVDLTAENLKLHSKNIPKVIIKDVFCGTAHIKKNYIVLPKFLEFYEEAYQIYYAVHEICHFIQYSHNEFFKKIENKALKLWDIKITRTKVYPKTISMNGQLGKINRISST